MNKLPHSAIYIHGNTNKKLLINQILEERIPGINETLHNLKGEVYSGIALQHFIDEELFHGRNEIETGLNNTLSVASSGEQRKALLNYILTKQPGFIILDDVFESLDVKANEVLLLKLKEISTAVVLIQLLNRKPDLLPFIENIYLLEGDKITGKQARTDFIQQHSQQPQKEIPAIPAPLHKYEPLLVPLVEMNNVSVQYDGRSVLQNICWQINEGEFWQLRGPNGSGKSTLLSMVTGDNPKAYGQDMKLFGKKKGSGETVWEIKEKIGYFSPNIIRHFERQDSIHQMIISGFFDSVGLYIKPTDMQIKRANDWLLLLGMYAEKQQPFRLFPPGQQRMILIARAMVKHPPLLILDEPTSGLDDESALLFTALVNQVAAETNTAILYVSHREDPGLKPNYCFELIPTADGSLGKIK
ncbi:MAG: ATP-binding cassette domain-containing protein [Ferruginibacter sp.]